MRTRSLGLVVFAGLTLMISACSTPASTGPAGPKIGLVTDVGSLDDKNFNQYSWEGAQDGASNWVGATGRGHAVSAKSPDIQSFGERSTTHCDGGFAPGTTRRGRKASRRSSSRRDQSFICITETGDPKQPSRAG